MADRLTRAQRSRLMGRVGQFNTPPELTVRRIAHSMGYRFRLHRKDLPGRPDIVFPKLRKAVFVHGCFWHRHAGCRKATTPKSNEAYWQQKFTDNVERDNKAVAELSRLGWETMIVWECETRDIDTLRDAISTFLKR
ncbi:DNA mismatch endonuclease Vsr [Sphingomonas sinipercae]|uniref:Very short patch repair endonuclease n=1 Tax=Sphingomonas sinipercae TaxID=2714944 RepID=A0A6G7ZLH8_9SPHN|nr:very short patch repair endonuclease [Sphingomonas sinipercae]QIL01834.1 DNA mismatch endonuclease Vsr [Sphingomonas sinipercae]